MFKVYSIFTEECDYELSAIITDDGEFDMCSLVDKTYPKEITIADSEYFLLNDLIPKLKDCVSKNDYSDLNEWFDKFTEEDDDSYVFHETDVEEILEILEEGKRLGFFKKAQNKKFDSEIFISIGKYRNRKNFKKKA